MTTRNEAPVPADAPSQCRSVRRACQLRNATKTYQLEPLPFPSCMPYAINKP